MQDNVLLPQQEIYHRVTLNCNTFVAAGFPPQNILERIIDARRQISRIQHEYSMHTNRCNIAIITKCLSETRSQRPTTDHTLRTSYLGIENVHANHHVECERCYAVPRCTWNGFNGMQKRQPTLAEKNPTQGIPSITGKRIYLKCINHITHNGAFMVKHRNRMAIDGLWMKPLAKLSHTCCHMRQVFCLHNNLSCCFLLHIIWWDVPVRWH